VRTAFRRTAGVALLCIAAVGTSSAVWAAPPTSSPFLTEMNVAMNRMMSAMGVKPTGRVDDDFVAMMVPHHEGAIEMAQAELRHGRNEHLRRIAQEIIVEQQQEIAAMRLAVGQPVPPPRAAPDQQQHP
jgi:uncharacterized protein (DUF305 family)